MKSCFSALFFILSLPIFLHGAPMKVQARQIKSGDIRVDGVLDEAVWFKAPRYTGFTLLKNGRIPANEETTFQVAASPDGIYWAFRAKDAKIKSETKPRDGSIWHDDCLELFLSADCPLPVDTNIRSGRHFLFNPSGSLYDDSWLAGISDSRWNCDWKAAVKRQKDGYTAEVFIPFYALELTGNKKALLFNVGRENYTGEKLEISVWSPCNAFLQMDKYAILELPDFNLTRFAFWKTSNLELKIVPGKKGNQAVLSGNLSGLAEKQVTLQAIARVNGRVMALNRKTIALSKDGKAAFSIPFAPWQAGPCTITLTGRDKEGKVFHTQTNLVLNNVPFSIALKHPVYRKSIFHDQANKTVACEISFPAATQLLKNQSLSFSVTDANGKAICSNTKHAAAKLDISIDCANWKPGDYKIKVASTGNPALSGTLTEDFSILPPPEKGNTVRLGEKRQVILNGKPFFPRGFMGGSYEPELFAMLENAGYNVFHFYMLNRLSMQEILRILDQAKKYHLKVIMYPYHQTGIGFFGFREPGKSEAFRLSPAAKDRLIEMVTRVKQHPAFFGWYLYDEPRGAEFCDELRWVCRTLREIDPHHPVIGLDCSAAGCIEKQNGFCDIHILDIYPNPRKDGSYKTPLAAIIGSMKAVSDNVGSAGAWFCPQAFNGSNFTPEKSDDRTITYGEIRCIVFGSLVRGATGILPYKIGNMNLKYFEQNQNAGIFFDPNLKLGYLKGLGPELAALEAVLNSPDGPPIAISPKDLMVRHKILNGKHFLIAVNPQPKQLAGTLHANCLKGTFQVLGEKRSLNASNASIKDNFTPYAVHIYTDDNTFHEPVDISALEQEIQTALKK